MRGTARETRRHLNPEAERDPGYFHQVLVICTKICDDLPGKRNFAESRSDRWSRGVGRNGIQSGREVCTRD